MNALPASIETYLCEAGFSGSEVLILKRLLEDNALTVRQLAAKTGKSVGVLEQALKKLHHKDIVAKEWINDTFMYTINSLHAVSKWMDKDMREKKDALHRRHQNFEAFLKTLELDKHRPEIRHFEGDEGMQKAYTALLDSGKEMLQFTPILCAIEDDPLRDFKVQYFRERRARGMYARVITHDTPLGRRFESRDPFEYRKTLLVPEEMYPFTFEKIIVGDTVACFNMSEKRACLLRYPELAAMERGLFESIWRQEIASQARQGVPDAALSVQNEVPVKTEVLSRLREFFLTKSSLVSLGIFLALASALTVGMYLYTSHLNFQRIRDKAVSIASTGVFQFRAADLDQLRVESDWQKPEWKRVVSQLERIRKHNSNILYASIYRRTASGALEYVADSHSMDPYANFDNNPFNDVDVNNNGKVIPDGEDLLQWPSQPYLDAIEIDYQAFNGPVSTDTVYQNQFGRFISGYAPILYEDGRPAAVLVIDISIEELSRLNVISLIPALLLLFIVFLFVLLRLAALNRSLLSLFRTLFLFKRKRSQ